jgi:hypothetical protein
MKRRSENSARDVAFILGAVATLGIPIAFTLGTVVGAQNAPDPSPFGYTVSMSVFIVPVIALLVWHVKYPRHHHDRRALFVTGGAIAVLGVLLDVMFGYHFLTFPDPSATIGVRFPAWSWSHLRFIPAYLPIEEFGFYIFGGFFLVGSYVWLDQNWMNDYTHDEYGEVARLEERLLRISPASAAWLVVLLIGGMVYKWYGRHEFNAGLPGYYIFLLAVGFLPTIVIFPVVRKFVNWRAFAIAYLVILLLSLVWEATLGVPYGWWGYNYEQMVGISILPWGRLPIEAVLLWLVISWTTVLLFEALRIYFHMDRRPRQALFGTAEK